VSLEVNCPLCGAKVAFRSTGSVVAICAYCKSTLVRHDLDLENVGRMADLKADGSPLQLGSAGAYQRAAEPIGNVHFAHSDLSGFSLFEEAQYRGVAAAEQVLD
jgi:hypothetical protein